jgi:hypothetical protein
MIAFGEEDGFADAAEKLRQQSGGAGLGGTLAVAATLADGDESPLELGDLREDCGHLLVDTGVAAVAEAVEVSFGRTSASAAATPLFAGGRWRLDRLGRVAVASGDLVEDGDEVVTGARRGRTSGGWFYGYGIGQWVEV